MEYWPVSNIFSSLQTDVFEEAVYSVSQGSISSLLRPAAATFDSTNLTGANVHYNDLALLGIFNGIAKETSRKKVVGQHKVDLVSLFNDNANPLILEKIVNHIVATDISDQALIIAKRNIKKSVLLRFP